MNIIENIEYWKSRFYFYKSMNMPRMCDKIKEKIKFLSDKLND